MIKLDLNPPANQLRQFGWIALIGFPLVGAVFHFQLGLIGETVFWVLVGLGVLMAVLAAAKVDAAIKPVYIGMMVLAVPIGIIISTVLLGLIYFGMFMPVGLVFRLSGRDLLKRKLEPDAKSYWRIRETQRTPASYLRLY